MWGGTHICRSSRLRRISSPGPGAALQHSPSTSTHVRKRELVRVCRLGECFGEHVGAVVLRRAMRDVDFAGFDAFAREVVADIDVLGPSMELRVVSEVDRGLVVGDEGGWTGGTVAEFREEGAEP